MDNAILRMTGITKSFFGVTVLNKVNFMLNEGEVHGLVGENGAGKSTLMKILLGLYLRDEGVVELFGENVVFDNPAQALDHGISMIHQEISVVPTMSVSENIWLGREDKFLSGPFLSWKKRDNATKELFKELEINIDPVVKLGSLSIAKMQLVEIARAISYDAKIIIMDEPTSALTNVEVEHLFRMIRKLSKKGVAIVFISHKLEEVLEICDSVTVLRDGNFIDRRDCQNLNNNELIKMIIGRDLTKMFTKTEAEIGEVVLEVKNFSSEGVFENINFYVRAGEIVGFSGLMGSGRTEIMSALFGIDKYSSGNIKVFDKYVNIKEPDDAINLNLGMVNEDRLRMGILPTQSVRINSTIANLRNLCTKLGFIKGKKERATFNEISTRFSVKYSSPNASIKTLSGGNQQKVILTRWLLTNPRLLILDEPTRGIDVGSKAEIYKLIDELANQGVAIIFVSSEMPELLNLCDRIYVIRNGKVSGEVSMEEANQEILGKYAFGLVE